MGRDQVDPVFCGENNVDEDFDERLGHVFIHRLRRWLDILHEYLGFRLRLNPRLYYLSPLAIFGDAGIF